MQYHFLVASYLLLDGELLIMFSFGIILNNIPLIYDCNNDIIKVAPGCFLTKHVIS